MKGTCLFPAHHDSGGGGGLAAIVVAVIAAAVVAAALQVIEFVAAVVAWVTANVLLIAAPVVAAAVFRAGLGVYRLATMGPAARRHWPRAVWARLRWRWLCRNLALAYHDKQARRVPRIRIPGSTAVRVRESNHHLERFPRARIHPDPYGLVAKVKTVPRVGRAEIEAHAQHIADAWGCTRVQVAQPKPGRLIVRGLLTDPLTRPVPPPPGVYSGSPAPGPLSLYVGRDEWGTDRWLPLPGVTGITVGGLPGYGKTSLINSWLMQLAGLPGVQLAIIDGKGGGDYACWKDRAWLFCGDDLEDAASVLEDVHSLMRTRLSRAGEGGPRNRWHVGPTVEWPLIVTVVDESHTFMDLDAVKGQKEAEAQVRACRALAAQLVKKGRAPLFLSLFITQKQDSIAIPTMIRDNCGAGFSFAVKTRAAAVCALGEQITEYPSFNPTTLQDPAYVGVCTASLRTGHDPFVRIKVPEVTEQAAEARAAETAHLGSDPALLAVPGPVEAAELQETHVLTVA